MTRVRPHGPAAALLALGAGLAGCSAADPAETRASAGTSEAVVSGPSPALASADLVDDVDIAQDTWTTTWRACFVPAATDAAVEAWEVQAVTAEGVSPRVEELVGACIDLRIGHGVGRPDQDPARAAALADAASIAYRARGVRSDGTVTPWSEPVAAGSTR